MTPNVKQFTANVGGKSVIFETGKLASQAGGAVTVRLEDSVIFAAATMGSEPREGQDFFPLTVEYEERMYAGGRIPGSFFRREGRPARKPFWLPGSSIGRCVLCSIRPCVMKYR